MNVFLACITALALATAGITLLWDLYRRRGIPLPAAEAPASKDPEPVPAGKVRLMIYECPRCGRRNRLQEGRDPRYAKCGRCFAEMANATLVGDEIASAEPDVSEDPAAVWVLRHEDLPASRPSRPATASRTVPRFEIPSTPLPDDIKWTSVDPHKTSIRGEKPAATPISPSDWPDVIGNIDPVTGTPIQPGEQVYLCTHCTTAYHAQTWTYLRDQNAGACASCNRQNTIVP